MNRLEQEIKTHKTELVLMLAHMALGFAIYLVPALSKPFGLFIAAFGVLYIIKNKNQKNEVLIFCAYLVGIDVFLRMTDGLLLSEQIKYIIIVFMFLGMFFNASHLKSIYFVFYLLLLVPGIYIGAYSLGHDVEVRKAIAFNLSGPVCLGICAMYCMNRKVNFRELRYILLFLLLPILSMATYLFFYTPSLREVITGTSSNFATSGGYGPNQISTVLGLGMFVVATRFFLYSNSLRWKLIHGFIFVFLTYRALLTFSRGGVITAFIVVALFIAILFVYTHSENKRRVVNIVTVFGAILVFSWGYSNLISGGLLEKRYKNQDALGREKKDVTTGRGELIESELKAFLDSPLLGIGVGNNKYYRLEATGRESASHNEVSRLLAEHGSLGILAFSILFLVPLFRYLNEHKNIFLIPFFILWFLTINHSAMRIAAPAFIYGLSLLTITVEKNTLHRKQAVH